MFYFLEQRHVKNALNSFPYLLETLQNLDKTAIIPEYKSHQFPHFNKLNDFCFAYGFIKPSYHLYFINEI